MKTPQEKIQNIKAWIKVQRRVANERYKDAEDRRDKSDYTDIEALETSAYNQGILAALDKLELLF
jgi:hypothetical protein